MIDPDAIQARFDALGPFLNERDRRLFAASEARAAGRGGIAAVSRTTGMARSTIGRGLADLRSGAVRCSDRVRRMDGGQKPATETQPGILEALNDLVEPSIRGDPEAPLRWVSKSQRHLSAALAERGFIAGQKLVGRLLKRLNFSLQANCKTREGANHPDRNAQFEHINAEVKAFQASGQPVISVDTKKKGVLQRHERSSLSTKIVPYSCVRDDGRPIGIGFQERVPNRSELLRSKDVVVSVGREVPGETWGR